MQMVLLNRWTCKDNHCRNLFFPGEVDDCLLSCQRICFIQDLRTLDPRPSRLPYGTYQYLDVTSHREWDMSKLSSGLHPQRRYSRMFYFGLLWYAHDAYTQRFLWGQRFASRVLTTYLCARKVRLSRTLDTFLAGGWGATDWVTF